MVLLLLRVTDVCQVDVLQASLRARDQLGVSRKHGGSRASTHAFLLRPRVDEIILSAVSPSRQSTLCKLALLDAKFCAIAGEPQVGEEAAKLVTSPFVGVSLQSERLQGRDGFKGGNHRPLGAHLRKSILSLLVALAPGWQRGPFPSRTVRPNVALHTGRSSEADAPRKTPRASGAGGLPLGVLLVSNVTKETVTRAEIAAERTALRHAKTGGAMGGAHRKPMCGCGRQRTLSENGREESRTASLTCRMRTSGPRCQRAAREDHINTSSKAEQSSATRTSDLDGRCSRITATHLQTRPQTRHSSRPAHGHATASRAPWLKQTTSAEPDGSAASP